MRLVVGGLVVAVLLLIVAIVFLLFIPNVWPEHLRDGVGLRISAAGMATGVAQVVALLLAAVELRRAQRAPKLGLWMDPVRSGEPTGELTRVYTGNRVRNAQDGVGTIYQFSFMLLLENYGDAPGRWVKASIRVADARPAVRGLHCDHTEINLSATEFSPGKWVSDPKRRAARWHVFHGGDDFIAYRHPRKIDSLRPWLEEIGHFTLHLPVSAGEDERKVEVQLKCSLQADNMDRVDETLRFRIGSRE